jgi:excisionase family DNA binding protein
METNTSATLEAPATMSVTAAARVLGISDVSAYRAIARGDIPAVRIGKRILVPTHRLRELLDGDRVVGR